MKARFLDGTCAQVFSRLDTWVQDQTDTAKSARHICALVGEAGTGKSTIASEFSRRLEKRGILGASFFFSRDQKDLNSSKKFFVTISSQLSQSQPALRVPIVNAAREHMKSEALQQLEKEFRDLLQQPLLSLPSSHPPFFVVVDALDECTDDPPELITAMLRMLLSSAAQAGSPMRVFLTSRPEPYYIHQVLTAPDIQSNLSVINIQDFRSFVDYDITALFQASFNKNATSREWLATDSFIVPRLVKKSDGLFIYARTAVDFILTKPSLLDMKERYDLLIQGGTPFGLQPLDTLYRTVLTTVFPPHERYVQLQERLQKLLGYLVTIQGSDGISPRTLERLTGMPAVESTAILNELRSVVIFERNNVDSHFQVIHTTFREFLVDSSRAGEAFHVQAEQAHGRLAEACTTVMQSFRIAHWGDITGDALFLQLLVVPPPKVENFPEVRYAQRYVDYHRLHANCIVLDSHEGGSEDPTDDGEELQSAIGMAGFELDIIERPLPRLTFVSLQIDHIFARTRRQCTSAQSIQLVDVMIAFKDSVNRHHFVRLPVSGSTYY